MNDRYEFRATEAELIINFMAIQAARAYCEGQVGMDETTLAIMSLVEMATLCLWDKELDCRVSHDFGAEVIKQGMEAIYELATEFTNWVHQTFDGPVPDERRLEPFKRFLNGLQ